MNNPTLHERHIQHLDAVNYAKTKEDHRLYELYLIAWRHGCRDAGRPVDLSAADMHYINQGIDRPMVCGVWLDWTPHV